LWETLVAGSKGALDGDLIRVVVVGSVAGGMSGVLCDVAYLARCAAKTQLPDDGIVQLDGYLASHAAFDHLAAGGMDRTRRRINTAASLRELQRFQLAENFGFAMNYSQDGKPIDGKSYLTGDCNWMLFDQLTLFGRHAIIVGPDRSREPWATTYASMADVIASRIDRALHNAGGGDASAGLRTEATIKQANIGSAVVAAAGSFAYRVPITDILEMVEAQWARKLFYVFMQGSDEPGAPSPAEQAPAAGAPAETPDALAERFVAGQYGATELPQGLTLIAGLQTNRYDVRDVVDFARANSDGDSFGAYLSQVLRLVLNGGQDENGMALARRAARLTYAIEFVRAAQSRLGAALGAARDGLSGAKHGGTNRSWREAFRLQLGRGSATRDEWQCVVDRLEAWMGILARSGADLQAVQSNLNAPVAAEGSASSLLDQRQAQAEARQKQMDQVAVRRYIWQRPGKGSTLSKEIFDGAAAMLPEHLRFLHWEVAADGRVRLRLAMAGTQNAGSSTSDIVEALGRLAKHVVRQAVKQVSLEDVFEVAPVPGVEEAAVPVVEAAWKAAAPHMQPALGASHQMDGRAMASVSIGQLQKPVGALVDVRKVLETAGSTAKNRIDPVLQPVAAQMVESGDRTALTIVRAFTLMPLRELPEAKEAWTAYCQNAGSQHQANVEAITTTAVFWADQMALEYEQRLELSTVTDIVFHALHPLVVLGMSWPERARLYAAAFAAGWLDTLAGTVRLRMPNGAAVIELGKAAPGVPPAVAGLIRFTKLNGVSDADVLAVEAALGQHEESVTEAWVAFMDQFTEGEKPYAREPQALQDLAAFAALEAYRRMVGERWQTALPTQMRGCNG